MKQILEDRKDIVFFIKIFPLEIHPDAYKKAKTIVCEQSLTVLERAFDGWTIPEPKCEATEVDDTIRLAGELGITGTPTTVLPDGAIISGFKDAATLVKLIEEAGQVAEREALEREKAAELEREKAAELERKEAAEKESRYPWSEEVEAEDITEEGFIEPEGESIGQPGDVGDEGSKCNEAEGPECDENRTGTEPGTGETPFGIAVP
jgi:hypothetical protein